MRSGESSMVVDVFTYLVGPIWGRWSDTAAVMSTSIPASKYRTAVSISSS
jgi:hypothetical protein